jgi:hypothetical protein
MMTMEQRQTAVAQLEACVRDVLAVDPKVTRAFSFEAQSLARKIERTLVDVFGRDAPEYARAVVTALSFKPPPSRSTTRATRAVAFAQGRVFAIRNLQFEIDNLRELLPMPGRVPIPGDEVVRAETGNFGSARAGDSLATTVETAMGTGRIAITRQEEPWHPSPILRGSMQGPEDESTLDAPGIYHIVTYDRTRRMRGSLPIPLSATEQIKGIAGFGPQDDIRESYSLDEEQIGLIAEVLGFRPEPNQFFYHVEPYDDESTQDASTEQRPAAYRFELRGEKIDVLPEPPEPENREFALDTYNELVAKARELHGRLKGTNSARRVCDSIERLLTALGVRFDDLRPGVLLSRERSIAADRAAFGNDDARDELFPDAIAMMDDTLQTLRDLMAAFPIVRRIEAERLALDLDRNADAIPIIQQQMNAIQAVAAQSGAVTEEAICALTQNDADIEDATDPGVRTGLVADQLLVVRNFAGAVIGGIGSYGRKAGTELAGLGGDIWKAIRVGVPPLVPPIALVGLAVWISGPVTGIAAAVATFKPMAKILESLARNKKPAKDGKRPRAKKRGKTE